MTALRLGDVGKRWQAITAVGATVAAITTAVFRPPPVGESGAFLALGGLMAAVVSGLVYTAMTRWTLPRHAGWWALAATASLVGAVVSFHIYGSLWDARVATYQNEPYIVGDAFTEHGAAYAKQRGTTNPDELLFDAAGVPDRIWTEESIQRVKSNMRVAYYASFPLIAIAVLATVQAVHCATRRPKRRSRKKPSAAPGDVHQPAGG
ncbi:MAG: hypothetical protein H0T71_15175 [Acidobacteria bacterium]|nr:hypothetical protein [Acidobacteriota bacterium]